MGLLSGIKKAAKKIKKAAKKIGKKAKEAADKIEESISAAGNVVGNLIEEGSNVFPGWFGGIASGLGSLIGTSIRAFFDATGGLISGTIKTVAGAITFNFPLIIEGTANAIAPIVGAAILGILDGVSLIQRIFGDRIEAESRPLLTSELNILRRIFHDSIDYDVIRLVVGKSGVFGINDRPFTKGNTIYMKDRYSDSRSLKAEGLLVHEITHVWQFQNKGVRYISEAAYAQAFIDDEYNWDKNIEHSNKEWGELNPEAQSQFFEDLYKYGRQMDRTIVLPGNNVPNNYDFPGAFFVDTEKNTNLEPVFPWHTAVVNPPYPDSGHVYQSIRRFTEFAIKATKMVRDS